MCNNCAFLKPAKSQLERESGFLCGHPSCRVPTIGPSNSSKSGLSQVGSAAHIAAARPNGPRYDASMTHEQRSSSDNGIWLCETHAKLIDTDAGRFPTDFLQRWKRQLRHLTQRALDHGLDIAKQGELVRLTRRRDINPAISATDLASFVGDFFDDVGGTVVWGGEVGDAARQVLTELLENDLRHGGATWARLDSRGHAIRLHTDGRPFSIDDLMTANRASGGHATVGAFRNAYSDTHILFHSNSDSRNNHLISDIRRQPRSHNPCSASAWDVEAHGGAALLTRLAGCPEVHLYFRPQRWTVSGGTKSLQRLGLPNNTVVVLHNVTPGPMADSLIKLNSHLSLRLPNQGS